MRDYGDLVVEAAVHCGFSLTWEETKRGIDMLEAMPEKDLKSAILIVKKIITQRSMSKS